jgi:lantibiotic modifying enzyme
MREKTSEIAGLVDRVLSLMGTASEEFTVDAGPAILASLAGSDRGIAAETALAHWLESFDPPPTNLALFGGLSGMYVGCLMAERVDGRLTPLVGGLRERITNTTTAGIWQVPARDWYDYDLITGAAGVILALCLDERVEPEHLLSPMQHLAALCAKPNLERLRIEACYGDELRGWNYRRVNTGLAHGVGGIAAALTAVQLRIGQDETLHSALEAVCSWFIREAYIDGRGLTTWTPAGRDGSPDPEHWSRRQAWCYGAPGLAWTLWNASCVLDSKPIREFAKDAMTAYCSAFDESIYFDDDPDEALAICHGAAGVLLIADAFQRHAQHRPAAALAERLEDWLRERGTAIVELARRNVTLLSGASGIASALMTRQGSNRDWLLVLGLR